MNKYFIISLLVLISLFISCSLQTNKKELKHYSVDNLNGIITQSGIKFDERVSSDGNGSIKIDATVPVLIQLYSIDDLNADDTQLIYEAKIKSESLIGQAYLEMWCVFNDKGEFFSRGFDSVISGTADWKTITTVFNLRKNEKPDQIKLNLVVSGLGVVWIDDISLSKME